MKRYISEARISRGRYGTFVPPKVEKFGEYLIVWKAVFGTTPGSWPSARNFAAKHYGIKSNAKWPVKIIEAEIKWSGGRKAQLAYVIVPDAHKTNCN